MKEVTLLPRGSNQNSSYSEVTASTNSTSRSHQATICVENNGKRTYADRVGRNTSIQRNTNTSQASTVNLEASSTMPITPNTQQENISSASIEDSIICSSTGTSANLKVGVSPFTPARNSVNTNNADRDLGIPQSVTENESDKIPPQLRFQIPQGPAPRTHNTSSSVQAGYSNSTTFSISSRGCTSVTAPSTTSTCSNNSSVEKQHDDRLLSSQHQHQNHNYSLASSGSAERSLPFSPTNSATETSRINRNNINGVWASHYGNLSTNNTRYSNQINGMNNAPAVMGHQSHHHHSYIANHNNPPSSHSGNTTANNDIDRIDSALLSALSDNREKIGLLRLEKVLVDFMNDTTLGYIEVGGPNNSIVISGQNRGKLSSVSVPGSAQGAINSPSSFSDSSSAIDMRGGKQTSFQRLCLHRLADRFNIVRESASTVWPSPNPQQQAVHSSSCSSVVDDIASNSSGPSLGTTVPGLIRLVKVKNSRVPDNLLIDLDLSSYNNEKIGGSHYPHRSSWKANSESTPQQIGTDNIRALTENMASASIEQSNFLNNNNNKTPIQTKKQRRKVKIMKRSGGSSGSLKGDSGFDKKSNKKNNMKGKNLSEREKMYAEARARIFNDSSASAAGTASDCASVGNTEASEASSNILQGIGTNMTKSFKSSSPLSSAATSEVGDNDAEIPRCNNQSSVVHEFASRAEEGDSTDHANNQYDYRNSTKEQQQYQPVATGSGKVSKVTWRNRRQEENDPDFRRGPGRPAAIMHPQPYYTTNAPCPGSAFVGSGNMTEAVYPVMPQHHALVSNTTPPKGTGHYNPHHQTVYYQNSSTQRHYSHVSHGNSTPPYYAQRQHSNASSGPYVQRSHNHNTRPVHNANNRNGVGPGNSFSDASSPPNNNNQGGLFQTNTNSSDGREATMNILNNYDEFPSLG